MMFPFYIDMQWEPHDPERWTPLVPVTGVTLAYPDAPGSLNCTEFKVQENPDEWKEAARWISAFTNGRPAVPVGFELRNKIWPCLVAGVVANGGSIPSKLVSVASKWNNLELVDVKALFLQGAFLPEKLAVGITLDDIWKFVCHPAPEACPSKIVKLHGIFSQYTGAIS